MAVKPLPDTIWIEIAKAAGGLPDEAREQVTQSIQSYQENEDAEFNRVESDTRKSVKRALENAAELSEILESLEQNKEFRFFNTRGEPDDVADLTETRARIDRLRTRLLDDQKRLSKRGRKNWARLKVTALVVRLLEIRTDFLNIDVPTSVNETVSSGPFKEYLKLCLRYADPELTPDQLKGRISEGLVRATRGFQERRGWETENFPSAHKLNVKKKD
jgi:hypothetical protein